MVNFEDHYRKQGAAKQSEENARRVKQYNCWVQLIGRVLIPKMIAAARINPPNRCEWVVENNKRIVSWQLWREYEDSYRYNLLPDGQLVRVAATTDPQLAMSLRQSDLFQ